MTTHASLSPSSAHRWTRCAGSVREGAKYPEPPSGPAAIDGTHSHTLLEHCIKAGLADPSGMVGVKMKDDDGEFTVDAERAARVKVAVDYVRQRHAELGGQVLAEQRVNPIYLLGRNDLSGTVDVQIRGTSVLEICDYKDGMNEVEAEGNEQLELYALGALASLQIPINQPYPFEKVRMTIVQPKLAMKGRPIITSHELTVRQVLDLIGKYARAAAATDAPDAPLVPGDKQCKYCRASACTARLEKTMSNAGVVFGPVTAPPAFLMPAEASAQVAAQDPAVMSDERLTEVLEAAPLMRQMIEAAEAEALRRLESGKSIPGLKLVYGRGSQVWNLPEEQVVEKLKGMGVPKDAIYKTSVVSPAQAKKLTWQKRDGTQKTLSERQLKTLETEYISKLAGKLTVAPASDPRPAVVRDASPLFQAIPSEVTSTPSLPDWLK